jgi:hypothetical protein
MADATIRGAGAPSIDIGQAGRQRSPARGIARAGAPWVMRRWLAALGGTLRPRRPAQTADRAGSAQGRASLSLVRRRGFARFDILACPQGDDTGPPTLRVAARAPRRRVEFVAEGVAGLLEGRFAPYGVQMRYAFDLRVECCAAPAPRWDSLTQWHGIPNAILGAATASRRPCCSCATAG